MHVDIRAKKVKIRVLHPSFNTVILNFNIPLSFVTHDYKIYNSAPLSSITSNQYFEIYASSNKKSTECIVELYNHAGIFKNTRQVPREVGSVLKNSQTCAYVTQQCKRNKFVISSIKCPRDLSELSLQEA